MIWSLLASVLAFLSPTVEAEYVPPPGPDSIYDEYVVEVTVAELYSVFFYNEEAYTMICSDTLYFFNFLLTAHDATISLAQDRAVQMQYGIIMQELTYTPDEFGNYYVLSPGTSSALFDIIYTCFQNY